MLGDHFNKRVLFLAGKGGVGRTTLSAAIGLAHAKRGRKTLVVEMGGTEHIPPLLGSQILSGYEPRRIHPSLPLSSCRIVESKALEEYGVMKLKMKSVYKLVFENEFMRRLMNWVPGMHELLMIGRIWHLEQQRDRNGAFIFDRIIVDAPATGHGLNLLQLPSVIMDTVQGGPFANDTRPILEMLTDRSRTAVHLVSLPEDLPTRETIELADRLRNDLDIAIGRCFVNRVWPEQMTSHERKIVRTLKSTVSGENPDLDGLFSLLDRAQARRTEQQRYIRTLRDKLPDTSIIEVPFLFTDHIGPDQLLELSHHMGKEPHA
jgi:anion-transporting  ArsA/GET3 family ATPase